MTNNIVANNSYIGSLEFLTYDQVSLLITN